MSDCTDDIRLLLKKIKILVGQREVDEGRVTRNFQRLYGKWHAAVANKQFHLTLFTKSFGCMLSPKAFKQDFTVEAVKCLWKMMELEFVLHAAGKVPVLGVLWPIEILAFMDKLFPDGRAKHTAHPVELVKELCDKREDKALISMFVVSYVLSVSPIQDFEMTFPIVIVPFAQCVSSLKGDEGILKCQVDSWAIPKVRFIRDILRLSIRKGVSARIIDLQPTALQLARRIQESLEFIIEGEQIIPKALLELDNLLLRLCLAMKHAPLDLTDLTIRWVMTKGSYDEYREAMVSIVKTLLSLSEYWQPDISQAHSDLCWRLIHFLFKDYPSDLFWGYLRLLNSAQQTNVYITTTEAVSEVMECCDTLSAHLNFIDEAKLNATLRFFVLTSRLESIRPKAIIDSNFLALLDETILQRLLIDEFCRADLHHWTSSELLLTILSHLSQDSNWRLKLSSEYNIVNMLLDSLSPLLLSSAPSKVVLRVSNLILLVIIQYAQFNFQSFPSRPDEILHYGHFLLAFKEEQNTGRRTLEILVKELLLKTDVFIPSLASRFVCNMLLQFVSDPSEVLARLWVNICTRHTSMLYQTDIVNNLVRGFKTSVRSSTNRWSDLYSWPKYWNISIFPVADSEAMNDPNVLTRLTALRFVRKLRDSKDSFTYFIQNVQNLSSLSTATLLIQYLGFKVCQMPIGTVPPRANGHDIRFVTSPNTLVKDPDIWIVTKNDKGEIEKIGCKKAILTASSPVLSSMITGDFAESRSNIINLSSDIGHEAVTWMVALLHFGEFLLISKVNFGLILDAFDVSDLYMISELKLTCKAQIFQALVDDQIWSFEFYREIYSRIERFDSWETSGGLPIREVLYRRLICFADELFEDSSMDEIKAFLLETRENIYN